MTGSRRPNRISSSGRGRPDRCKLDQRSCMVYLGRHCTTVNCNPNCKPTRAPQARAGHIGRRWLILEDADGLLFDAEPAEKAFATITGPWQRAALAAGWNPCYGRYLVADLRRAGLGGVAGRIASRLPPGGSAWLVARLGIERMRGQVEHEGASQADLDDAVAALDDPARTVIGAPKCCRMGPARPLAACHQTLRPPMTLSSS